jgi:hypothetical protein
MVHDLAEADENVEDVGVVIQDGAGVHIGVELSL